MKRRTAVLSLMGVIVALLTGATAQATLVGFSDAFDYSTGDLVTNSTDWVTLGGAYNVVSTPTGSLSGLNVITNPAPQVTNNVGRNVGQASDGDVYDFRLSVYTGSSIGNSNDILMRITNNTALFGGGNNNIVFQAGIGDGILKAFRGTPGGGAVDSEATASVVVDNWYEIRALYTVDNGGSDSVVIDYRDITGAGSFANLTSYTIVNALSQGADNNYTVTSRDWFDVGLAADDASVSMAIPEPSCLALLSLGSLFMLRRRR